PKEPSKVRPLRSGRGAAPRAGGGADTGGPASGFWRPTLRRSFEMRSSTAETTKSPASSMSTPAWATAHGVGRLGPARGRKEMSGEEKEGNVVDGGIAADDRAELHAVHVLRTIAADDEIGPIALEGREGEGGARRGRDLISRVQERRLEYVELCRVGVHDEDLGLGPGIAHDAASSAAPVTREPMSPPKAPPSPPF